MWPFRKKKTPVETGFFRRFTDCHSHLLPGVDDGVETMEESLTILHEMERVGVSKVWLTPHIMEDIPNKTSDLQFRFRELETRYPGTIELALAAEYMLDNLFQERLEQDDLLPLQEGKRYLLVETSYFNPPMDLLSKLKQIQSKGYYPLLAHPERYVYMSKSDYKALKEEQISFQLNVPALFGMYGKHIQEKAEWLLKSGMYDLRGNDIHAMDFYSSLLGCKIKW